MLDCTATTYVLALLFVYGEQPRDWLCSISRDGEGPWRLQYRFRYHAEGPDQDPWNGRDKKSFYEGEIPRGTPEAELLANALTVARALVEHGYNDQVDVVAVRQVGPEALFAALQTRPWAAVKTIPLSPGGDS